MNTTSTVVYLCPKQLKPHPLLNQMPMLQDDDPEYEALLFSIKERGIDYPLILDEHDQILDGRHRQKAALDLSLETVPCIHKPDMEALAVGLESLYARRHYTLDARAYLVVPFLAITLEEAKERRLANLKKGQAKNTQKPALPMKGSRLPAPACRENGLQKYSVETLSVTLGICREILNHARKAHELFKADPKTRAKYEHAILSGEMKLWALFSGEAGGKATKGMPRKEKPFKLLFKTWAGNVSYTARRMATLDKAELVQYSDSVAEEILKFPPVTLSRIERRIKESKSAAGAAK
jgi:hypothetical protein